MPRVLMVCMGNICRSPLAEGIARHHATRLGKEISVDSAGTYGGHVGDPPDSRAQDVAKARGVNIADLRARKLTAQDFFDFDWILVADDINYRAAQALMPKDATACLGYLLDSHPDVQSGQLARELPDPYYGSRRDFESVYDLLDAALSAWVEKL